MAFRLPLAHPESARARARVISNAKGRNSRARGGEYNKKRAGTEDESEDALAIERLESTARSSRSSAYDAKKLAKMKGTSAFRVRAPPTDEDDRFARSASGYPSTRGVDEARGVRHQVQSAPARGLAASRHG